MKTLHAFLTLLKATRDFPKAVSSSSSSKYNIFSPQRSPGPTPATFDLTRRARAAETSEQGMDEGNGGVYNCRETPSGRGRKTCGEVRLCTVSARFASRQGTYRRGHKGCYCGCCGEEERKGACWGVYVLN